MVKFSTLEHRDITNQLVKTVVNYIGVTYKSTIIILYRLDGQRRNVIICPERQKIFFYGKPCHRRFRRHVQIARGQIVYLYNNKILQIYKTGARSSRTTVATRDGGIR